jgi:hypothetical protein
MVIVIVVESVEKWIGMQVSVDDPKGTGGSMIGTRYAGMEGVKFPQGACG